MNIEWIDEQDNLAGKIVLVRAGLNVPVENRQVVGDFRIRRALPTLQFLQDAGAKTIVISHIGREGNETLRPVSEALNEYLPHRFIEGMDSVPNDMQEGDIVLLENLRQDGREVTNDETFAREFAQLADMFVQDAFSVCHREHTSIVGIPNYLPSYGGLLLKEEIQHLTEVLQPEHPALFILGGAKLKTKEPLIKKYIQGFDSVFIGGALQNEILLAKGYSVGKSVVGNGVVSEDILNSDVLWKVEDVTVEHADGSSEAVDVSNVGETDMIVDMGENTMRNLALALDRYKTVVWNGPLGWYEKGYRETTLQLARALRASSAKTIIGGGDTVAVLEREGFEEGFYFVSTGGGAMLAFLTDQNLPGLVALQK